MINMAAGTGISSAGPAIKKHDAKLRPDSGLEGVQLFQLRCACQTVLSKLNARTLNGDQAAHLLVSGPGPRQRGCCDRAPPGKLARASWGGGREGGRTASKVGYNQK